MNLVEKLKKLFQPKEPELFINMATVRTLVLTSEIANAFARANTGVERGGMRCTGGCEIHEIYDGKTLVGLNLVLVKEPVVKPKKEGKI